MQKSAKRKQLESHPRPKRSALVDDWRRAYKWASVQISALILASQGLIVFVPTVKEWIPSWLWHAIMGTLAICAIIATIKKKPSENQGEN